MKIIQTLAALFRFRWQALLITLFVVLPLFTWAVWISAFDIKTVHTVLNFWVNLFQSPMNTFSLYLGELIGLPDNHLVPLILPTVTLFSVTSIFVNLFYRLYLKEHTRKITKTTQALAVLGVVCILFSLWYNYACVYTDMCIQHHWFRW